MDRDIANREIVRLIEQYRSLPFADLVALADGESIETELHTSDGRISFSVNLQVTLKGDVRIEVAAFGDNWWKLERIDESIVVSAEDPMEKDP